MAYTLPLKLKISSNFYKDLNTLSTLKTKTISRISI